MKVKVARSRSKVKKKDLGGGDANVVLNKSNAFFYLYTDYIHTVDAPVTW